MGHQTEGRLALIKILVDRGSEPPAHSHSREDESYFVLKGSVRYTIGDLVLTVNEGEFVYLPKDVPHKFEVQTSQAELANVAHTAGLDQWFWDNSVAAPDGQALPVSQGRHLLM